jgi:hypothetical protein
MTEPFGTALFATICNAVGETSPYTLWFTDGRRQFVADLSAHMEEAAGLTGVAFHDGRLYLAVQSHQARILVLDMSLGLVDTIRDDLFNDLHALRIAGGQLLVVSARGGAVVRRDLATGESAALVRFDPRAWVCDVLPMADDLLLCAHNLPFLDPAAAGGGVFSVRQRKAIVSGLSGPHTIIANGADLVVLDSAHAQVVFFGMEGERRRVALKGFLRGAVVTGPDTMLVAGGPDRTISRKNPEGDGLRGLRQVLDERLRLFDLKGDAVSSVFIPEAPAFEIYDLMRLTADAGFRPDPARIIPAEPGLFARFFYTSLVTAHARASQR